MVLNTESKYPNRRAYVLMLRADATPGALAGSIENLVTGRRLDRPPTSWSNPLPKISKPLRASAPRTTPERGLSFCIGLRSAKALHR